MVIKLSKKIHDFINSLINKKRNIDFESLKRTPKSSWFEFKKVLNK